MMLHFNRSAIAITLALIFSLPMFGVSVNAKTNSTLTLQPNVVSGLRGSRDITTLRRLQVTGEITGAFDIVVLARFNDLAGGYYQRVFDFGNGAGGDNVWLGQVGSSKDMAFEIVMGPKLTRCVAPGAIVQGELATWKAGVDSNGVQWLEKNGRRLCSIAGQVPRNVVRANKLLGQSNFAADTPMKGAVLGFDITNVGERRDGGLLNKPDQIRGPFAISVQARFDAPQAAFWQRVFDFGNGPDQDNILLGQLANSNDMIFDIWQNRIMYRLVAPGAIVTGQLATWRVGVDASGLMWVEKDGIRIAQKQGIVPAAVQRNSNLLGSSNWGADAPLDGVVLGLSVSTSGSLPVPVPVPVPVPLPVPTPTLSSGSGGQLGEITGAFDIVVMARFNDLAGGYYQRVFDFGNGAGGDNVWLGQVGNSKDMAFEIVIGPKLTRCVAPSAIVQGELATWKTGVDSNGVQWLEKNGSRLCSIAGQVPRNVVRTNKLLGQSNFAADTPMKGAVIGFDITNVGERRDGGLLNKPDQIRGPFAISVQARFDAPQAAFWQRVFDFGNGPDQDNILLGQLANSNDMIFDIWQNRIMYRLVAPGAIVTGQLATWRVGVDANGLMWMEKDGTRIAQKQGIVPAGVQRNSNLLGSSNWGADAPLDGVVLGLSVSSSGSLPVPVPVPLPAPVPIPPGSAVLFSVAVNNYDDPLFRGLNIPANAAQAGMWSGIINWPIIPMHAAVMIDGRVVTYGSPAGNGVQDGRTFTFWNPKLGTGGNSLTSSPNVQDVDSFCSSAQTLPSGKLLISGGASEASRVSGRGCTIIDPLTSQASRAADLNLQRWYGSQTSLPDGRQLMTGGGSPYAAGTYPERATPGGVVGNIPEVYTDGQGWRLLNGAKSDDAFGFPQNHWWYPRQWVTNIGSVFGISTEKMWEMQVGGEGTIRTIGNFKTAPNTNDKTLLPNNGPTSTAVMYDVGKIIQVGGNGYYNGYPTQSSKAATTFDINRISTGSVVVTETAPMANGRQWANANVLPNGQVLVTGGSRFSDQAGGNAVLAAETWNPATGTWTTRASAAIHRGYHSSAVLLPNGAVFTGGGGVPGPVTNFNAEIYYPPYFFTALNGGSALAKRPTIISLSTNRATYGEQIQLQLGVGDVASTVSFIALPSNTHSFDPNMRRMTLIFQRNANGTITVTMPSSANLAPPGYYYLSVVNGAGVPSLAVIFAMNAVAPPR